MINSTRDTVQFVRRNTKHKKSKESKRNKVRKNLKKS